MTTTCPTASPEFRREPPRAETARANRALSRGPATNEGRARSSMSGLVHGLRARRHLAVLALGEDAAEAEAHLEAVRAELGAHRARTQDLLSGGEEAGQAQAGLDTAAAELPVPSEPRTGKVPPIQPVRAGDPANDDAASPAARWEGTGEQLLRLQRELPEDSAAARWRTLSEIDRAKTIAAAQAEEAAPEPPPDASPPPRRERVSR